MGDAMMCRSLVTVVVLVAVASMASAADDIRLTYHIGMEEFTFDPPGVADEKEDQFDESRRIEAGLWGVERNIWGLAYIQQDAEYADDDVSLDYRAMGGRLYFGQAYRFSSALAVEFISFAGWSHTAIDVDVAGVDREDNSWLYEYGIDLQVLFQVGRGGGLVVGAGGGYLFSEGEFELDGDRSFDQQGWTIHAIAGWRF